MGLIYYIFFSKAHVFNLLKNNNITGVKRNKMVLVPTQSVLPFEAALILVGFHM